MTITQTTRSTGATNTANPRTTRSTKETTANKENTAAASLAAQGQLPQSGIKQPSSFPKRNYATTTSSSRRKQLNDALNSTADNIPAQPAQPAAPAKEPANSALNRSQPILLSAAPLNSAAASTSSTFSSSLSAVGSSHLKRPSESSLPNPNNWSSTSTILAAIPGTPQTTANKRSRLTFTDLTAASQSERDAARERIIAEVSSHSTSLTQQLNVLYDEQLDGEASNAMKHKICAKQFDYKSKIVQLNQKIDLLKAVLGTYQSKVNECRTLASHIDDKYTNDLIVAHTRSFDLQQKCYGLERSVRGLQTDKSKLQAEKEAMVKELGETVEGKERVEIMVREYEKVKAELAARVDELETVKCSLERDVERLTQDKDDATNALLSTEREHVQFTEKLHRCENEIVSLNKSLVEAHVEFMKEKEETYRLEKLRVELIKSMDKQADEMRVLRSERDGKVREVNELTERVGQLQQSLDVAQRTIAAVEREKQQLDAAMAENNAAWEDKYRQLQDKHDRDIQLLRKQKDDELTQIKQQLVHTKDELDHMRRTASYSDESSKRMTDELSSLRDRELQQRRERNEVETKCRSLEQELKYVEMELKGKKEECAVMERSREKERRLEEELKADMKRQTDELDAQLAAIKDEDKRKAAQIKQLTASLAHQTDTAATLSQQLRQTTEERDGQLKGREDDREAFTTQKELLNSQLVALQSELAVTTQRLTQQLSDTTAAKAILQQRYDETAAEFDSFKQYAGVSDTDQLQRLVRLSVEAETMRKQLADKGELSVRLMETQKKLDDVTKRMYDGEKRRRELHNTIQELKGNVRVMVRVRPAVSSGMEADAIECHDDEKRLKVLSDEGKSSVYSFDHVFGSGSKQQQVFDEVASLVQSALDGYHVCLFSYGQTGSGKTHTMSGNLSGEGMGIIPRSVSRLLQAAREYREEGWQFTLECSFLEIYNETVRDLLSSKTSSLDEEKVAGLEIKRDADGRTVVPGSMRMAVTSEAEVVEILRLAAKHRSVAATSMNARSSRSHSIFTLYLTGSNSISHTSLTGSLNLCDLAGSERLSKSHAEGARLKETQAINKSLSALADVFTSLSSGSKHVPYRNSKLTYLLQPCLSGDGKTLMIVNVSGEASNVGETICSLRFAAQVNQCELGKPKRTARLVEQRAADDEDTSVVEVRMEAAAGSGEHSRTGSSSSVKAESMLPAVSKKPSLKASLGRR